MTRANPSRRSIKKSDCDQFAPFAHKKTSNSLEKPEKPKSEFPKLVTRPNFQKRKTVFDYSYNEAQVGFFLLPKNGGENLVTLLLPIQNTMFTLL